VPDLRKVLGRVIPVREVNARAEGTAKSVTKEELNFMVTTKMINEFEMERQRATRTRSTDSEGSKIPEVLLFDRELV
jgi:hypothetical protein